MRKTTIILFILTIVITFTLLTCDLLNRPMTLILPNALFAGDSTLNKADGLVEIYDYEETETIINLEIITTDGVDTTKILTIPSSVTIPENELSVTFTCEAEESDILSSGSVEVTVRASRLHYNDAEDTIMIHDATAKFPIAP
ncbi:MAG: hypothetical protein JXJ04_23140 [Spirochaetales bacterium]|nr:hypothetical protein [Spirochaetales bacterium]